MKTITKYCCGLCHAQYDSAEEAQKCEKSHKVPEGFNRSEYSSSLRLPLEINVKFSGGSCAWYRLVGR